MREGARVGGAAGAVRGLTGGSQISPAVSGSYQCRMRSAQGQKVWLSERAERDGVAVRVRRARVVRGDLVILVVVVKSFGVGWWWCDGGD